MDILGDMGVSKLSAKVFFKSENSFTPLKESPNMCKNIIINKTRLHVNWAILNS